MVMACLVSPIAGAGLTEVFSHQGLQGGIWNYVGILRASLGWSIGPISGFVLLTFPMGLLFWAWRKNQGARKGHLCAILLFALYLVAIFFGLCELLTAICYLPFLLWH
jgi:MFS family permease